MDDKTTKAAASEKAKALALSLIHIFTRRPSAAPANTCAPAT